MTRYQDDVLDAARDTLMHISAVSGVAAKRLRHGQSLEADLGLDDAAFAVLADRQQDLCNRLQGDGMNKRVKAEELRDMLVWQILQLTPERGAKQHYTREQLIDGHNREGTSRVAQRATAMRHSASVFNFPTRVQVAPCPEIAHLISTHTASYILSPNRVKYLIALFFDAFIGYQNADYLSTIATLKQMRGESKAPYH